MVEHPDISTLKFKAVEERIQEEEAILEEAKEAIRSVLGPAYPFSVELFVQRIQPAVKLADLDRFKGVRSLIREDLRSVISRLGSDWKSPVINYLFDDMQIHQVVRNAIGALSDDWRIAMNCLCVRAMQQRLLSHKCLFPFFGEEAAKPIDKDIGTMNVCGSVWITVLERLVAVRVHPLLTLRSKYELSLCGNAPMPQISKPRRRPGRPSKIEEDKRLLEAWETRQYKTYKEIGLAFDMKPDTVRKALARAKSHRKK